MREYQAKRMDPDAEREFKRKLYCEMPQGIRSEAEIRDEYNRLLALGRNPNLLHQRKDIIYGKIAAMRWMLRDGESWPDPESMEKEITEGRGQWIDLQGDNRNG